MNGRPLCGVGRADKQNVYSSKPWAPGPPSRDEELPEYVIARQPTEGMPKCKSRRRTPAGVSDALARAH